MADRGAAGGAAAGRIGPAVAREVGLSPETVVAQGGIDAHAGRSRSAPSAPETWRSSWAARPATWRQSPTPVFANIWGPYPTPGGRPYILEGGQTATGSIVQWLVERFGSEAVAQAKARGQDVYAYLDGLAEALPAGSEGLLVLDHFQGNRTPHKDPLARGTFVGLTLNHTLAHLYGAWTRGSLRHATDPGRYGRARFALDGSWPAAAAPRAALDPDPRRRPGAADPPAAR